MLNRKTTLRRVNGHWAGYFHDTIYRAHFHVIWDVGTEQLQKYCSKNLRAEGEFEMDDADAMTITFQDNEGTEVLMAFDNTKMSPSFCDTLAHECFHAASFVLDSRGVKLSAESNEAYAYFLGSLVSRSLELINKTRGKKRAP